MRIALTALEEITGKDGREWVRVSGFAKSGKSIKAFMPATKFKASTEAPDLDAVALAMDALPRISVEFDEDGRVEEATD